MRELIANTQQGPITVDLCGRVLSVPADATQDFILARDGLLVIRNGTLDLNSIRLVVRRSPTMRGASSRAEHGGDGSSSSSISPLAAAGLPTSLPLQPCLTQQQQQQRRHSLMRRLSSSLAAAAGGAAHGAQQVRLEELAVRGSGCGGIIQVDGGRLACVRCKVRGDWCACTAGVVNECSDTTEQRLLLLRLFMKIHMHPSIVQSLMQPDECMEQGMEQRVWSSLWYGAHPSREHP